MYIDDAFVISLCSVDNLFYPLLLLMHYIPHVVGTFSDFTVTCLAADSEKEILKKRSNNCVPVSGRDARNSFILSLVSGRFLTCLLLLPLLFA